ncbi:acyl-CoA dehydrogenase, N-terminal domain protein, partial [Vibrio parahaemolyticus 10296]
DCF